ncbi:OmpA family protein [Persicimonas caeni]|uniref:OmpA family protein n=1 Tax=Persicimonas caeni TaxID=2292766 RepID=A0A4Y6PXW2_PERCE|nr:OmpA family protein [Persicimonas caeni]QDG52585.1 OmpA family protein [Persicimonas caeni]QED33807.1 OmpA family protein [Persicimonas caeni]
MNNRNARLYSLLVASLLAFGAQPAFAQEAEGADDAAEETKTEGEQAEEGQDEAEEATEATEATEEGEDAKEDEDGEDDEPAESAHGSYEWKPSWGGGVEAGVFFSDLDRWNRNLLEDEAQFDTSTIWHFDGAVEASFIEGTRLSVFGGFTTPFADNPSLTAWYVGLEPAFAFRRDEWEMAVGLSTGVGGTNLSVDPDKSADTKLVLLRPFLEVRRYLSESAAVYVRGGFNQWLPFDVATEGGLQFGEDVRDTNEEELDEGGAYLALGVRFGSYPEHVKIVPDTDGDGFRDDVDSCPEKPEDEDGFEDEDGCPELDNDDDGINDDVDECPNKAEDKDGWKDEDGCPETDDDTDGDGILDKDDECPEKAEDKDGFEDEDGCPDPDNDEDGIADADDECPNQKGVAEKNGCPLKRVVVTLKRIMINEKVFFEYNKADIQEKSFDLLNEVAQVIKDNPRIKKIEIQGHTDHKGSDDYNMELSDKRAKSVHDYLVEQGVDADRLTSKGYGETDPLVPLEEGQEDKDETEEAAAQNRRVEFVILEQEDVKKVVPETEVPEDAAEVEETDETVPVNGSDDEKKEDDEYAE